MIDTLVISLLIISALVCLFILIRVNTLEVTQLRTNIEQCEVKVNHLDQDTQNLNKTFDKLDGSLNKLNRSLIDLQAQVDAKCIKLKPPILEPL